MKYVVVICLMLLGCTRAPEVSVMTFPEAALFEVGKSELKPEGQEQIKAFREKAMEELSQADKVIITGYTDDVGEADDNAALSLQRAGSGP
jgi:outer membrane protein OmpA-like peptidoglycan-associated protein